MKETARPRSDGSGMSEQEQMCDKAHDLVSAEACWETEHRHGELNLRMQQGTPIFIS
jgi:hypothetical protein